MSVMVHLVILTCVAAIATGQILFKLAALTLRTAGTAWHPTVLGSLGVALTLYMLATLGWVWALQHVALSRAYLFMSLAFVLVPAAGWLVFGERLDLRYAVGVAFILIGVAMSAR